MNKTSFYRKVAYITAVALLLMPLAYLSQPVTGTGKDEQSGKLAELRQKYNLSQAQLGDIDPGSESMRLALFGLHGIAAHLLWEEANYQKKVKNWNKLEANVKQIVRLQPNFKSVWEFQAHNLAYNVSVEFDNVEHRYDWVKKGIEFLIKGTEYNRDEPIMYWNIGWFTGQKIGRSDEHLQFRRYYRDDKAFHDEFRQHGIDVDLAPGADGKPDNWYTAKLWFEKGQVAADESGRPIRGKSPLIYHNQPAMSLINGSDAMEKETYEGETEKLKWDKAQYMWSQAEKEYAAYGSRMIPTSWGHAIRLGDLESIRARIAQNEKKLQAFAPEAMERIKQEHLDKLTPQEREILNKPTAERSAQEQIIANSLDEKLKVSAYELADASPPEDRPAARKLADQILEDMELARHTNSYRGIINFDYWTQRCKAEKTKTAILAHQHLLAAEEANKRTDLTVAKEEYEKAFGYWREIYDEFPLLMDNAESQDLVVAVGEYTDVLGQLDEEFSSDFILNDLLQMFTEGQQLKAMQRTVPKKDDEDKGAGDKKEEDKPEAPEGESKPDDKPATEEQPKSESKPDGEKEPESAEKPAAEETSESAEKKPDAEENEPAAEEKPAANADSESAEKPTADGDSQPEEPAVESESAK